MNFVSLERNIFFILLDTSMSMFSHEFSVDEMKIVEKRVEFEQKFLFFKVVFMNSSIIRDVYVLGVVDKNVESF